MHFFNILNSLPKECQVLREDHLGDIILKDASGIIVYRRDKENFIQLLLNSLGLKSEVEWEGKCDTIL